MPLVINQQPDSVWLAREKKYVLMRFNTRQDNDSLMPWRVLVATLGDPCSCQEMFVEKIICNVPTVTTQNEIAEGIIKWHLAAEGYISVIDGVFYISPSPVD